METDGTAVGMDEYAVFVGSNWNTYRPKFEAYEASGKRINLGWHWPSLFLPFWWALYRKLYLAACFLVILFIVPAQMIILLNICFAAVANSLYHRHARKKILAIRAEGGGAEQVAAAGGVHLWVVYLAGFVVLATYMLRLYFLLSVAINAR